MPQSLRTLLLTCLAWFMPLRALNAGTGQWHSAEAAELRRAAKTAWVASDTVIDARAVDDTVWEFSWSCLGGAGS
jgi:hypothetical protein